MPRTKNPRLGASFFCMREGLDNHLVDLFRLKGCFFGGRHHPLLLQNSFSTV